MEMWFANWQQEGEWRYDREECWTFDSPGFIEGEALPDFGLDWQTEVCLNLQF